MLHLLAIAVAAIPAIALCLRFAIDGPGANPIEAITHTTGEWALRWVLVALAITPLRRWFGLDQLAPLRRTLGLVGFAYASVHLATWLVFEVGLEPAALVEEITEHPYVTAGMGAFALLLPLAVTSTRGWIRKLGPRWVQLHQFVYAAAILAVVHHYWLTKADYRPVVFHAAILMFLLIARLIWLARGRRGEG